MDGFIKVEVWVIVDEDGNVIAHEDKDACAERYRDDVCYDDATARRVLKLTVNVPMPKPVELAATLGEEPAAGELKVA